MNGLMINTLLSLDNPYLLVLLRSETMLRSRMTFEKSQWPESVRSLPPRQLLPDPNPFLEDRLPVGEEKKVYLDSRDGRRLLFQLPLCGPARFAELREKPFLERRMRAWHLMLEPMERLREDLAWTVTDLLVEVPDVPLLGLEDAPRFVDEYLRVARQAYQVLFGENRRRSPRGQGG